MNLSCARERKKKQQFEAGPAEPPRELVKKARAEGKLPALKKPPPKKRKRKEPVPEEKAEEPVEKRRIGSRGGTRSQGTVVWKVDDDAEDAPPVGVQLAVVGGGAGARVQLRLTPRAQKKPNKSLAALQDFLGQGHRDPFANDSVASVSCEMNRAARSDLPPIKWGCLCGGNVFKGGAELKCRRCDLTFHAKCERLDYSAAELKKMAETGSYICSECEQLELLDAGYDPEKGRFIWQCRYCTRSFESEDHHAAEKHGNRCMAQLSKRQWSCLCKGKLDWKTAATQCKECSLWFHAGCKSQQRNWWEVKGKLKGKSKDKGKEYCAACESKASTSTGKEQAAAAEPPRRSTAAASAVLGSVLGAASDCNGSRSGAAAAGHASNSAAQATNALAALGHNEVGTLADACVAIRQSTLGEGAGLGLFATSKVRTGEVISSYYGTPLYKEEISPDL